jgi:hypothetical protein
VWTDGVGGVVVVVFVIVGLGLDEEVWAFVIAAQEAKEVQVRQLQSMRVSAAHKSTNLYQCSRFAILAQDDTFGKFLGRLCVY